MDNILEDTANRILATHRDSPVKLWSNLEESGLTRLWVSEALGGFELSAEDGFGLIRLAGRHAAPVPLADTLVATWFLTEAEIEPPPGAMAILISDFTRNMAFGAAVDYVVRVDAREVTLHAGLRGAPRQGIGEDPLIDASELDPRIIASGELKDSSGLLFAAMARAAQICGALEAVLEMTICFAGQREQFGRALSKFQAIQHLLSEMGAETAAANAALNAALATIHRGCPLDRTAIAIAKYRANMAASIVAEHAHQVHGAIGYTQEYALARFTRRLWQWRDDFGGESFWADALGRQALADAKPLWFGLTEGYDQ